MAFDPNVKVTPIKFGNIDATFDERGSTFLALRKIQWCQEGNEPDESLAHYELRKWRVQSDGSERADKGFAFLTPEGPNELAKMLVHEGFGYTKDILQELRHREDFKEAVEHINDEEPIGEGEYFDLRSMFEEQAEEDENEIA